MGHFFQEHSYTYIFDRTGGIYDASMQGCCWKIDAIFMLDRSALRTTLKFIFSEKATKSCKISTIDLSYVVTIKPTLHNGRA